MIILDTNVLSELISPKGSEIVTNWTRAQLRNSLYTTAITQAEILYGIAILPIGRRRQQLYEAAQAMFKEDFTGKILTFDSRAAEQFSIISSHRRQQGTPISQFDAQIAAICCVHEAKLATRNVKDFVDCNVDIINPWNSAQG